MSSKPLIDLNELSLKVDILHNQEKMNDLVANIMSCDDISSLKVSLVQMVINHLKYKLKIKDKKEWSSNEFQALKREVNNIRDNFKADISHYRRIFDSIIKQIRNFVVRFIHLITQFLILRVYFMKKLKMLPESWYQKGHVLA